MSSDDQMVLLQRIEALTKENAELRTSSGADFAAQRQEHVATVVEEELKRRHHCSSSESGAAPPPTHYEMEALRSQVGTLQRAAVEHSNSMTLLQASLDDTLQENEFLHQKLTAMEGEVLPSMRAEVEDIATERNQLSVELAKSAASTDTDLLQFQRAAAELENANNDLRNQLATRETQLQEQAHHMAAYLRQQQVVSAAVRDKDTELQTRTEERDELKLEVQRVKEQADASFDDERQTFDDRIEAKQAELVHLKNLLAESQVEITSLRSGDGTVRRAPSHASDGHQQEQISAVDDTGRQVGKKQGRGDSLPALPEQTSMKQEMISFWIDGHKQIEQLQAELCKARKEIQAADDKAAEVRTIIASRRQLVDANCALNSELERLRDDLLRTKTERNGQQVELDFLRQNLSEALGGTMSNEELSAVAATIRKSGEIAAAASASVVYDEAALKKAMKESQTLKHEIGQLRSQREGLRNTIIQRERTLTALQSSTGTMLLAAKSVKLGDGSRIISLQALNSIFRDLQSPYVDPEKNAKKKAEQVELHATLDTLQEAYADAVAKLKASTERVAELESEKDFEHRSAEAEIEALRNECQQATKMINLLTVNSKALKRSAELLESENRECTEAASGIKDTSVHLITLLSQELQSRKQERDVIHDLKGKLVTYEETAESQAFRITEGETKLITDALNRHSDAIQNHLSIQERRLKREATEREGEVLKSVSAKDELIAASAKEVAEIRHANVEQVKKLEEDLTTSQTQLVEAKKWVTTLEQKSQQLSEKLTEADDQRKFFQSKLGSAWVQSPSGDPTLAKTKQPASAAEPSSSTNTATTNAEMSSALLSCVDAVKSVLGTTTAPAAEVAVEVPIVTEETESERKEEIPPGVASTVSSAAQGVSSPPTTGAPPPEEQAPAAADAAPTPLHTADVEAENSFSNAFFEME